MQDSKESDMIEIKNKNTDLFPMVLPPPKTMEKLDTHLSTVSHPEVLEKTSLDLIGSADEAQARSFFNCKFHQKPCTNGQDETDEKGDDTRMGCIICKVQVQLGKTFIKEELID